ncbi:ThuA domain-containing protein [Mucisphaera calidilacus]|uniref:Trehalose utilization n=1 Tax=Mucisphaera calidilacus TaxID=2527982 RepID=A0A518C0X0_9BACT|nr:ThuA domain-containing protein [Mucisphaera calidilacus]QDU72850.1 Trehalose utilization [Mucisphaera calidilacus]
MASPIRVTVWHEHRHELENEVVQRVYPKGMHTVMKEAIEEQLGQDVVVRTALLDDPEHGLTELVLAETDVLTWWGHMSHGDVADEIVTRVQERVLEGMGLIVLHSGHYAKIFKRLLGTTCSLRWREIGELERIWCVNPGHPIADGIDACFEVPQAEMYGELFDIPEPDELVFVSWFEGGEVFRSGCCWRRGKGRLFYFRPGHETYPIYYQAEVRKVLGNAVKWAAPASSSPYELKAKHIEETLSPVAKR